MVQVAENTLAPIVAQSSDAGIGTKDICCQQAHLCHLKELLSTALENQEVLTSLYVWPSLCALPSLTWISILPSAQVSHSAPAGHSEN